jgi:hypothetical protein
MKITLALAATLLLATSACNKVKKAKNVSNSKHYEVINVDYQLDELNHLMGHLVSIDLDSKINVFTYFNAERTQVYVLKYGADFHLLKKLDDKEVYQSARDNKIKLHGSMDAPSLDSELDFHITLEDKIVQVADGKTNFKMKRSKLGPMSYPAFFDLVFKGVTLEVEVEYCSQAIVQYCAYKLISDIPLILPRNFISYKGKVVEAANTSMPSSPKYRNGEYEKFMNLESDTKIDGKTLQIETWMHETDPQMVSLKLVD